MLDNAGYDVSPCVIRTHNLLLSVAYIGETDLAGPCVLVGDYVFLSGLKGRFALLYIRGNVVRALH
jgi:hypothetical protein